MTEDLQQRCQPIELILSDVDGVLTDGGIILDNNGIEAKRFHVRDGLGIKRWRKAGYRLGLNTIACGVQVSADRAGEFADEQAELGGVVLGVLFLHRPFLPVGRGHPQ